MSLFERNDGGDRAGLERDAVDGVSRRSLLKGAAAIGAGAFVAGPFVAFGQ